MRLTTRDKEILRKLQRCKWLTTSQIQRVFFPGVSLDPVRKRMHKLADAKYLQSYQRHHMSEMLHGLGKPPKLMLRPLRAEIPTFSMDIGSYLPSGGITRSCPTRFARSEIPCI